MVGLIEQDEFADWLLVIVEDNGDLTPVARAYSPDVVCTWAHAHGIKTVVINKEK